MLRPTDLCLALACLRLADVTNACTYIRKINLAAAREQDHTHANKVSPAVVFLEAEKDEVFPKRRCNLCGTTPFPIGAKPLASKKDAQDGFEMLAVANVDFQLCAPLS